MLQVSVAPAKMMGAVFPRGGPAAVSSSSPTGTAAAAISCDVTSARDRNMTADRTPNGGTDGVVNGDGIGGDCEANGSADESVMNGKIVGGLADAAAAGPKGPVPAHVDGVVC